MLILFFQAEDGIRDLVRSRGLGDVYKRQGVPGLPEPAAGRPGHGLWRGDDDVACLRRGRTS